MAQFGDREHYIPIRKSDLVELLASDSMLHEDERQAFREFCELLAAYYHFLYHDEHEKLKDAYDPFDPDSETHRMQQLSDTARYTELGRCFDHLEHLLERANFTKLSKMDLYDVIEQQSHWGLALDVDFEVFERLELFVRGEKTTQRGRRRWQNLFREEMVDLNVYERVVMVLHLHEHERLRGERVDYNAVYIKLFKNIPKLDLDMLLPGTRVRMTVVDQGKIILPTITGVFTTLGKLVTGGIAIATASITGILAMLGLIGGTIGYGIKSFFGYLQTKQKYQFSLTQSLYYQNLDNNAGVISRILDEAEEQECREAILAYFFLWRHATGMGWCEEHLDNAIESYLEIHTGLKVDFEVDDALAKLEKLRIIEEDSEGKLKARPIREALAIIDHAWDNFFQHHDPDAPPETTIESRQKRSEETAHQIAAGSEHSSV